MIEITREAEGKGSEMSPKVEKRDIQIDDLFRIRFLNSPEISPDGRKIAFTYKWTDLKKNTYYSNLYVADIESGVIAPFTRGDQQDSRPRWSPDGKSVLFCSERDEKKGLWIIPAAGGEAGPLMTDKGTLGEYVWSPDGKKIAFTFRQAPDPIPPRHISNDPEYRPKDEDRPYEILEKIPFKTTGGELLTGLRFHIYLLDVKTGEKEQLTQENFDDGSLAFSPDGAALAFCSNRSEDPVRDYENNDIYVLDLGTRKLKKVTDHWGPKNAPAWSEDGKFLYFAGHRAPRGKGGPEDVQVYRIASGGGEPILITQDFRGYVGNLIVGDTREFDVIMQPFGFPKGSDALLFSASYEGGCFLYEVSRNGGKPVRIEDGEHEIAAYSVDRQGENVAVLRGDLLTPPEIYHYRRKEGRWEIKRLTSYNEFLKEETTMTEPKEIRFTGSDGVSLQGWLLSPPGFDPTSKYPLIHQIHGGPHILYGYSFFHEMHYFAAKGYCTLFINPRGSRGYGTQFTSEIHGAWGTADVRDQMEFLDHVIGQGFIDETSLFLTGGSYGGYMTNWLVTQTDRYRAAASHRSVSNLMTQFGISAGGFCFEHTVGGVPWKDYEHLIRHSPLFHAEKVKTPLLLMHSENDHLTPIGEAEQFFVALKYLHKEARFVRFRNETHGLSRAGKPTNRRARLELVLEWFEEHRTDGGKSKQNLRLDPEQS